MKKISILGSPLSGKVEFGWELSELLGLPLHHLDDEPYELLETNKGRTFKLPFKENSWIIEGNGDLKTLPVRFFMSDLIIILDFKTNDIFCSLEILKSYEKDEKGAVLPINWAKYTQQIATFKESFEAQIQHLALTSQRRVVVLKTEADVERFIKSIAKNQIEDSVHIGLIDGEYAAFSKELKVIL